mgnify:CR=1 FL=1
MPFKDINWNKVAKQTAVSYNIGRTNALINAKTDKDIHKVELLSGVDLLERDPLDEAIKMEKIVREQQPIISKLTEISEKTLSPQALTTIMQNFPAIDYNRVAEDQPLAIASTKSHRRTMSDPITIDMNEGIDPTIISKYKFKMPNEIIKEVATSKDKMDEFGVQKKSLENMVKTIASRSKHDVSLLQDLQNLRQLNIAYNRIKQNKELLKKPTSTSTGKGVKSRIYYTNPKELVQRLGVLAGEVQAGNKSKRIKNEIADISHHLYKKKVIKKAQYRNILTSM